MEESIKILKGATSLFMRIGIKSVSMDDIAR
ncbi:MAG: AcrR family transcriptional regulator, partial [Paracoccaceae bacterium]